MLKKFLQWLLTLLFKVEVKGLDNYKKAGNRVLIIANHSSYLDPLLLGVFLPDDITFAINTQIAQRWWLKPFLGLSQVFPMDPRHPISLKDLIHRLNKDSHTVIFPEGRITTTGSLMKIYDGTGMVADKSGATLLPIRIHGAEYTHFSKLHNIVRLRLFPKITLQILPPTKISAGQDLHGKNRRKFSGHVLADIMTEMMFATSPYQQTIFASLLAAKTVHGGKKAIIEDMERSPLSYDTLITRSIALGNALTDLTSSGENIGVLLPNSTKTLCVVLGLQLHGRVPAMLNFTTGYSGMLAACQIAQVKTVLTSRRFIELGKLTEEATALSQQVNLIYLEDLASNIGKLAKLKAWLQGKTANFWYKASKFSPDSPAVVLFTSGSEGSPKGVVLSHANILGNITQVQSRISFNAQDVVLNFLPMFHSFGFTVGSLLPVLNGMTSFLYPTPLHYAVIPEIAYEINATIMFGTNTFFSAYAKKAHAYDFHKLRYVVAGAEKLQASTREIWAEKFGIRILEGYGATETSPVAAVNTPMDYKAGTVGRLMPAMQYQLETVEGINDGGRLHLKGPNIMLGYLLSDNPGHIRPPESCFGSGWYDTGDIAHVDDDGFVSIRGRSKRFAKIGGEMVSLTAAEQLAAKAWPNAQHAVVTIPDTKKGEQIILLTTETNASTTVLSDLAIGIAAINLPRKIMHVKTIPVTATGKINYPAATELALDYLKLNIIN
ncbi:MAG: AMP-binding protein [Methylococcaceae bacterium]|jgi:acyl-[acyl-carrier-protein]-phospholipid O-acyltransferase/long-chain-fatty-acid--[acyl-carrier-protein] ligase